MKKFVTLSNGERLAYIEKGAGETLLYLHGNMSSCMNYIPLFDRVTGYRLIAVDLRGFGDSTYNTPIESLKDFAADVLDFADKLNVKKAHVVGWSAGAGIAFEIAAARPDFVKSIFAIEGMSHKGYPLFSKNADGTVKGAYADKEAMKADPAVAPALAAFAAKNGAFFEYICNLSLYPIVKPTPEQMKLYVEEILKQRNLTDFDWALANFNMSAESNGYRAGDNTIKNVTCPVTLTTAGLDYVVPRYMIEQNLSALPAARLIEYPNRAHSLFISCPDQLASDILEHLKTA